MWATFVFEWGFAYGCPVRAYECNLKPTLINPPNQFSEIRPGIRLMGGCLTPHFRGHFWAPKSGQNLINKGPQFGDVAQRNYAPAARS